MKYVKSYHTDLLLAIVNGLIQLNIFIFHFPAAVIGTGKIYLDLDTLGVNINISSAAHIPIFIFDIHTVRLIVHYFQSEVSASIIHEVNGKRPMGSSLNAVIVVFGLISSSISISVVDLMFMMSLAWIIYRSKILRIKLI